MSDGKVIINKLHRFLRQRSVPANNDLSPVSNGAGEVRAVDDEENGEFYLEVTQSNNNHVTDESRASLKYESSHDDKDTDLTLPLMNSDNKVRKFLWPFVLSFITFVNNKLNLDSDFSNSKQIVL